MKLLDFFATGSVGRTTADARNPFMRGSTCEYARNFYIPPALVNTQNSTPIKWYFGYFFLLKTSPEGGEPHLNDFS